VVGKQGAAADAEILPAHALRRNRSEPDGRRHSYTVGQPQCGQTALPSSQRTLRNVVSASKSVMRMTVANESVLALAEEGSGMPLDRIRFLGSEYDLFE
jgi:hypothetical protein